MILEEVDATLLIKIGLLLLLLVLALRTVLRRQIPAISVAPPQGKASCERLLCVKLTV